MLNYSIFKNEPDVRSFSTGQIIFNEGQASDGLMYAVVEGEVEITHHGRSLEVIPAGGVFGEMALLDQHPRSGSAVAKTDCRVAAIAERRFTFLIGQNPYFALDLMRLLAKRVRANLAD